jgi:hypothetical protein
MRVNPGVTAASKIPIMKRAPNALVNVWHWVMIMTINPHIMQLTPKTR